MLRKTVSIDEYLFAQLEQEGVLDRFKNFSDLVSSSLRNTMESVRREGYRKQLEQMASDPMVIEDISRIEEDFRYADGELDVF
jgi:Arc/MetJ-type ribon-helix-helix transcriptional regulator